MRILPLYLGKFNSVSCYFNSDQQTTEYWTRVAEVGFPTWGAAKRLAFFWSVTGLNRVSRLPSTVARTSEPNSNANQQSAQNAE